MPTVYISLGSNIGDRDHYLRLAVRLLDDQPQIHVAQTSSIYRSEALTRDGRPGAEYLNAVCRVTTTLLPHPLWQVLRQLEKRLGRVRYQAWGARTIDLDLLAYENRIQQDPRLTLPHPEILMRDFVLRPLVEIAPHWRHPVVGRTAAELLEGLADSGQDAKVLACCGSLS